MEILSKLLSNSDCYALLEDSKSSAAESKNLLFTDPQHEIIATTQDELTEALEKLESCRKKGLFLCGYLSYEAGYSFLDKNIKNKHPDQPLLYFIAFKKMDHLSREEINTVFSSKELYPESQLCLHDLALNVTKEHYLKSIDTIKKYIEAGDTYQINYTIKYKFILQGNAASLYQALRQTQPVEFGALLNFPKAKVVSLSPELFIKKKSDIITSKPMKGTAKRGADKKEDDKIIEFLKNDPKTLSENVMIVDLIRNDFGRICEIGSVHVNNLFQVQTFKTIHQVISTVKGTLKKKLDFKQILHALFPCGSITGAPKIRTMEIINELETEPRGIYTGAIGYLLPDNDFYFNVPIRTIAIGKDNHCEMGIGSGIIYESDGNDEFAECLLKADFLTSLNQSFYLIESFKYNADKQVFYHLKEHLYRLQQSSRCFGFKFSKNKIEKELAAIKKSLNAGEYKIRLSAFHNGKIDVSHSEILKDNNDSPKTITISTDKIDSSSVFQYHKTSRRELYNQGFKSASQSGFYDVVFLNERNQVAEASRHNIFIRKGDKYFTPPLSAGILNGVYRQQFMLQHDVEEVALTHEELIDCDEIILTNSVRGAVTVKLG